MTIVLHSTPATAEGAAEILGLPKTRVKWLKGLVPSRHAASVKAEGRKFAKNGARTVAAKGRKKVLGKRKKSRTEVFLSIPYDDKFDKLFLAYIAGITAYGMVPRATLEITDSSRRLEKILNLERRCRYSVHDLSRVQLDRANRRVATLWATRDLVRHKRKVATNRHYETPSKRGHRKRTHYPLALFLTCGTIIAIVFAIPLL